MGDILDWLWPSVYPPTRGLPLNPGAVYLVNMVRTRWGEKDKSSVIEAVPAFINVSR